MGMSLKGMFIPTLHEGSIRAINRMYIGLLHGDPTSRRNFLTGSGFSVAPIRGSGYIYQGRGVLPGFSYLPEMIAATQGVNRPEIFFVSIGMRRLKNL